ncbi:membrane protein insertion efficiency factor YidD [Nocardioides sp.]|uniref:membrane protein insertion efficiency factor YidD n=1 Tax=Nocardioides sp. TaxID=35761 RepID=UPI0027267D8B|nr:membrane protein insertion efficiency factor YidD [Nocardioides sp.]MDO9458221.1 membrane protein insertion efficiency factor YidD [Nocardioides sp.]
MGNALTRYRQRRARRRQEGRRKRDWADCADCGDCGDCSPFMLSPLLLLVRVLPGAFRADAVDPWVARPGGVLGRVVARLIRSYQVNVSVPRSRPVCTMTPTCSRYGLQAVSRHGCWRGGLLVVRRLRRCGTDAPRLDPVPPAR